MPSKGEEKRDSEANWGIGDLGERLGEGGDSKRDAG